MLLHATIYASPHYMLICSYIYIIYTYYIYIYIYSSICYCMLLLMRLLTICYMLIYMLSAHTYMLGRSSRTCIVFFTHLYAISYCMLLYVSPHYMLIYMLSAHMYMLGRSSRTCIVFFTHLYALMLLHAAIYVSPHIHVMCSHIYAM